MSFADNLYAIRKKNGLTQEDVAEMLGISRQAVSRWEQGDGYPERDKLVILSEKFGIPTDDLLGSGSLDDTALSGMLNSDPAKPDPDIACSTDDATGKPAPEKKRNLILFIIALLIIAGIIAFVVYSIRPVKVIDKVYLDNATEFRYTYVEVNGPTYICKKGDAGFETIREELGKITGKKTGNGNKTYLEWYKLEIVTPDDVLVVTWGSTSMFIGDNGYKIYTHMPALDFDKYFK